MKYTWNEEISIDELNKLFKTCDWNLNNDKGLENAFKYSWKWLSCRNGDELIGFVRILSDGFSHGYICSMIVSSKYHGSGVGSKMLDMATTELKKHNINPLLLTKGETVGFYEKNGYSKLIKGIHALKHVK